MSELTIGTKAPEFSLQDSNELKASLKDFLGKWIILYFYPKDNTSGCTTEALDFTELKDDFEKLNAVIIGISPDSCKSHQNFIKKYELQIKLLSDTEKKTLENYGVWQLKKMYGKEYQGVVRTTYLIDTKGTIAYTWNKVKVKGHGEDVLTKLKELSS